MLYKSDDVSEEHITSVIRLPSWFPAWFKSLKRKRCSSETSVDVFLTIGRYIREDCTLHCYRCENFDSNFSKCTFIIICGGHV
jgi:hypothetical protein